MGRTTNLTQGPNDADPVRRIYEARLLAGKKVN